MRSVCLLVVLGACVSPATPELPSPPLARMWCEAHQEVRGYQIIRVSAQCDTTRITIIPPPPSYDVNR